MKEERDQATTISSPQPEAKQKDLSPSNMIGFAYCILAVLLTISAALLSRQPLSLTWLFGQIVFALAFMEWFLIMHEVGHRTLFKSRWPNKLVGTIAGFFALIPYSAWCHIHARHHVWIGWQDKDATTATLVPRPLSSWEKGAINFAWRTGLPLFSILYRLLNYWHVGRLRQFLSARVLSRIRSECILLLLAYTALAIWIGPLQLIGYCGFGLFLALVAQDIILLGQHTHMPRHLSEGKAVRPFPPRKQEAYTRSVRFPYWFSLFIMHFDAHALHHMFIRVPGYRLRRIDYAPKNEVNWWSWIKAVKRLSGVEFLFGRRDESGFPY